MHTGVTGQIRKTAIGRWLLFHVNTGLFWIYGILTLWLAFSLSGFCVHGSGLRLLVSLPLALLAAFTLARFVHFVFWQRFHNIWMDSYVIGIFLLAILLSEYVHDVQDGRDDALSRLATHVAAVIAVGLISFLLNRKRAA